MAMGSEQQQTVGSRTVSVEEVPAVLQLRATQDPPRSQEAMPTRHNVRWEENVVDNENMNKKRPRYAAFFIHKMRMKKSATIIQMMMDPLLPDPLLQNLRMRRILTLTNVDKEDWKGAIVNLRKKGHIAPMLMKSNQIILNTGENSRKRRTEALYNESQNIR